jgi:hypothetical protein
MNITKEYSDNKCSVYHNRTDCAKVVDRINAFCQMFIEMVRTKISVTNKAHLVKGFWQFTKNQPSRINNKRNKVITLVNNEKFELHFPGIGNIKIPSIQGTILVIEIPKVHVIRQKREQKLDRMKDTGSNFRLVIGTKLIFSTDAIDEYLLALQYLIYKSIIKPPSFKPRPPMLRSTMGINKVKRGDNNFTPCGFIIIPSYEHEYKELDDFDGNRINHNIRINEAYQEGIRLIFDEQFELLIIVEDIEFVSTCLAIIYCMPKNAIDEYHKMCVARICEILPECRFCNVATCIWAQKPFRMITHGKKGMCPMGDLYCISCHIPYHGEGECPKEDQHAWLSEPNHLICPSCEKFIVKDGGCNHIECTCGTHFCSVCRVRFVNRMWPHDHACPQSVGVD